MLRNVEAAASNVEQIAVKVEVFATNVEQFVTKVEGVHFISTSRVESRNYFA